MNEKAAWGAVALVAVAVWLRATPVAAQERETAPVVAVVSGIVTGSGPDDPLPGAMVYVKGQSFSAMTDSLGRYAMAVLPGAWLVSVYHGRSAELGLDEPPTSFVTTTPGGRLRLDFSLREESLGTQARPYTLEALEVVVAGQLTELQRAEGAHVDFIDRARIEARLPSARHLGDLIQGEFTGLRIMEFGAGNLCVAARRAAMVRSFEGVAPESCPGQVAVVLDGIFVDDPAGFLASLAPDQIERVEFMPAMTASTRYGLRAGNGVLLITTR